MKMSVSCLVAPLFLVLSAAACGADVLAWLKATSMATSARAPSMPSSPSCLGCVRTLTL